MVDCSILVPKLFLIGAFLGSIGCLGRADYNLPIFLYSYIVWTYMKNDSKINIIYILSFSIFVDILWFFMIYLRLWASEAYKTYADWETGLHVTVSIVVLMNFVWKIVCIILSIKYDSKLQNDLQENYRNMKNKINKRNMHEI